MVKDVASCVGHPNTSAIVDNAPWGGASRNGEEQLPIARPHFRHRPVTAVCHPDDRTVKGESVRPFTHSVAAEDLAVARLHFQDRTPAPVTYPNILTIEKEMP